jgi:trimeric autotransporter adhesin
MKHLPILSAISITALLAAAGTAYGQQPPDVVQSDSSWNTAMGTEALQSVTPNSCLYCGIENTAAGAFAMQNNTSGGGNVAVGFLAMQFNVTGHNNTGVGDSALQDNTTGEFNTAVGSGALLRSTTAYNNTGIGLDALVYNTTGGNNTATGANALFSNTTAGENTAIGYNALYFNTTGGENTASGAVSLYSNKTGNNNTATGYAALQSNTNGASNTASGNHALYSNTTGFHDTADGAEALFSNTTGNFNTAFGLEALFSNRSGSNNVAVGTSAGYLTTGSNNIDIGNQGAAGESGTIRVGAPGAQTVAYIAGIENAKVTGSAVYVTAKGQLGVLASSERYKTAITSMENQTDRLQRLRPVTFHLKTEPQGDVQYGLIAEEVAKVYPELVVRNEAGKIEGVRYDELAPMLLNEVQRQAAEIRELKQQQKQFATQAELNDLKQQLQAALAALRSKDELVALR